MSSSSTPELPDTEATRLAVAELEEAEAILEQRPPKAEKALGEAASSQGERRWVTVALAAPSFAWLGFYLLAPLVIIVLVSFWTYKVGAKSGFTTDWTLANYGDVFHNHTYWDNMIKSFETSLIAVAACLVLGFPIAYFLALKVQNLRNQIALFILALAPFWTSFLVRSVAWTYPLMGRTAWRPIPSGRVSPRARAMAAAMHQAEARA